MGVALCLAAWPLADPPSVLGQGGWSVEYRQKAMVLTSLPKFVEWPAQAFPSPEAPLEICVYGSFRFGTGLAEAARGQIAHERRIEVRWVRREGELRSCHVLFLSGLDPARVSRTLEAVRGGPTLTVGELKEFLKLGGMVHLSSEDGRMYFDVSLESAGRAGLRISSKLLMLARHVVKPQGPGKPEPIA